MKYGGFVVDGNYYSVLKHGLGTPTIKNVGFGSHTPCLMPLEWRIGLRIVVSYQGPKNVGHVEHQMMEL